MKQLDGNTEEILALGDIGEKFRAFGLNVQTIDGNDIEAIYEAIQNTKNSDKCSCIVLNTIKGKGLPSIESIKLNHHIQFPSSEAASCIELLTKELAALEAKLEEKGLEKYV